MYGSLPVRRTYGCVFIVIGAALIILALFSPWLRLSTTFGTTMAGEHDYGPAALLSAGGWDAFGSVALGIGFPVVALAASTMALLVVRKRPPRTLLRAIALELAIGGLMASLCVVTLLPIGLRLTWPYFTLQAVEYGAWAAIVGFACATLGVLILHTAS